MTKVALIGLGHWGPNLARNFATLGALAAICDSREMLRVLHARTYPHVRVFASADDVFASDIGAVAIATPAASHGVIVRQALSANKHVFVEKPLCLDLGEARELGEEAKRRSRVLMVGHLLLYHPAFLALGALIATGRIGTLRYIYSNRLSLGKIRREENALWSFAPHDISMILSLTAAMPERVMTSGGSYLMQGVADTTLSHLSFQAGVQAHIFVSWLHPYKEHRLVVVGSEGMANFDDNAVNKLTLYPHAVSWDGDLPSVTKAPAETISYADGEPLALECQHFLDCVATGAAPRSDTEESIRVLSVLDACQRSLRAGNPVALTSTA